MARPKTPWETFLEEVEDAKNDLKAGKEGDFCEFWYRGQVSSKWDLEPSLFRPFKLPIIYDKNPKAWEAIWEQEQDLYYEFSARARELHGKLDDWDVLFAMQHYGAPTRLLDWTDVFGVGVYFALHDFTGERGTRIKAKKGDMPCVWIINPYELNVHSDWRVRDLFDPKNLGWCEECREYFGYGDLLLETGMDWDSPVAIYPQQRTDRMQAQHGWFSIHGDQFLALNDHKKWHRVGRQVLLPPAAFEDAHRFLEDAGLGLYSLFPDLTNLAAELKQSRAQELADCDSKWLKPKRQG